MQQEIYKDIPGYEGIYQASTLGRIKSLNYRHTKKQRILKPTKNGSGYFFVTLCKYGTRKVRTVHQLVTEAFFGHKPNGRTLVVNHIDFDKLNNKLDNLEIVTMRENSNRKHIKSSSKYVGVGWHKGINKWQAQIMINKKLKYLGTFMNEISAYDAYRKALKTLKQ